MSVKKNIVSMPFKNHKGEIEFEEVSIYDTRADLDRGPNSQC